jgi:hypothetical protein
MVIGSLLGYLTFGVAAAQDKSADTMDVWQGGKLFGQTTNLTTPNDAQGEPKTCTACKGADKDQPIVGLVIIKAEVWGEDGKLKVRGSLGPFYKTQTWNKAD